LLEKEGIGWGGIFEWYIIDCALIKKDHLILGKQPV
jgi:hypothetical protein